MFSFFALSPKGCRVTDIHLCQGKPQQLKRLLTTSQTKVILWSKMFLQSERISGGFSFDRVECLIKRMALTWIRREHFSLLQINNANILFELLFKIPSVFVLEVIFTHEQEPFFSCMHLKLDFLQSCPSKIKVPFQSIFDVL